MSLNVPTALLDRAEAGDVTDAEFVACVAESLPYAWSVVSGVVAELRAGPATVEFAEHSVPPPGDEERGQLLRMLASDAIRGGIERHLGVTLAFQNCHTVHAYSPGAVDSAAYRDFCSPCGQLLNQSPTLRNC